MSEHSEDFIVGFVGWRAVAKRAIDIFAGLTGLLATSWLLFGVWLLATIDTGRNGLFTQMRIGKDGKLFRLFKIRTMRAVPGHAGMVTTADDPRVTALGRLLRKTKLDELPQLINVVQGTMSLVGPRPTVEEDWARMNPRQRLRAVVRPGITGLAQISGGTSIPWPRRIEADLDYIAAASLMLDMKILANTVTVVLSGRVATDPETEDEWSL